MPSSTQQTVVRCAPMSTVLGRDDGDSATTTAAATGAELATVSALAAGDVDGGVGAYSEGAAGL